jgi:zinc resistance-associated protein
MKKGKFSLVLLLAVVMSLSLAASSWARPWGGCMMGGGNLNTEQAGQLFDLKQKFMNDTADLRKAMMIKRTELSALWRAENPDEKQILAKQKEVNALREQMQQKSMAFKLQARKICPQGPLGMGPHGGMGPGAGMGMDGGCPGLAMGPGGGMGRGGCQ